jgi:hypothetical protein
MATRSNHRTDEELWEIIHDPTKWPGVWTIIIIQPPTFQITPDFDLGKVLQEAYKASPGVAPNIQGVQTADVIDIPSDQIQRLWSRLGLTTP